MSHPLIREIQLGKSADEVVRDNFVNYDFQNSRIYDDLPRLVKEIMEIGRPDVRFAVKVEFFDCYIGFLNAESNTRFCYWNDQTNDPNETDAESDCEILNEIVDRLFGQKRKKPKAKITNKEFLSKKGKICPFCLAKNPRMLNEVTWATYNDMGCRKCGETWKVKKKVVLTGFSR